MDREDNYQNSYHDENPSMDDTESTSSFRRRRDRTEEVHSRLLALLDEVEAVIDRGGRIPFTSRVLVDRDMYLDAIDALRMSMPEAVAQAERIVRDREQIILQADAEAERVVSLAREQAAFLISERQLLKAAEMQSATMISAARDEAKEIVASAQKYARDLLMQVETEAARVLAEIRRAVSQVPQGELGAVERPDREAALMEKPLRSYRGGRADRREGRRAE